MEPPAAFYAPPRTPALSFAPAVLGGPTQLSPAARAEIQSLSGHRPVRFLVEVVLNWSVIAAIIWIGVALSNWLVTLACICAIGVRQMVFGLLIHEQVHRLGLRGRYGDWIANALVAYPIFATTVEDYAKVHLSHHKYFMTRKDPDFLRKSGDEWTFPMGIGRLVRVLALDLTGMNTAKLIRGKMAKRGMEEFTRCNPSPLWFRVGYYAVAAGALTLVEGWTTFLIYWAAPVLTVTQLWVRWIAAIEHQYNVENSDVLEVTPFIRLKWWQRILFPDLNFAMHAYHHLHPGVSFSNLPRVHEIYRREGLVDEQAIFDGQGAFLKYLVGRRQRS
jgi:fatty acid desaturase